MREVEARLRLSAVDRTAKAFSAVQRRLNMVERQTTAFNRAQLLMNRTQTALYNGMGMAMTRFAGPAVVGLAAYKIGQAASNMEDALFSIQKKTGASVAQMQTIRGEMKQMAAELPVSMEEIAAAFERGGAAGIPLDQLREFAELSVKVSDAWDMSAEDVANAFAGFSAGMGIKREELEAYADLINSLADAGIADESGIVDFIDRAGANLKQFGLAKEEIAAYGTALLNLKLPAETAARAMNTLTNKLIAPENLSPKARKALGEVVGDLNQFAKFVEKDAGGALDSFFGKLEQFSNADRARILGGLLGEGFSDEITRLVSGLDELKRNLDAAKNSADVIGSIDAAAERKVALWSSQVQLLKNNMEVLADTMGSPALSKANDFLKDTNAALTEDAAYDAGLAKETQSGGTKDEALAEYYKRWSALNGERVLGTWSRDVQLDFEKDMARYGRGEISSPYGTLDAMQVGRDQQRFPDMDAGADAAAAMRARNARNIDGGPLSPGSTVPYGRPVPVPYSPPDPMRGLRDQYSLLGEGSAANAKATAAALIDAIAQQARGTNNIHSQWAAESERFVSSDRERDVPDAPSWRDMIKEASAGVRGNYDLPDLDGVGDELSSGGEKAGQSIREAAEAINRAGEDGGSAFARILEGVGRQIGIEAGNAFNATARAPRGGGLAMGNPGRTMPDAGGFGGPR